MCWQPNIDSSLIHSCALQNLPQLCSMVTECASAFCVDFWLQTHLHQCGALWHLLLYLFNYDYTLEEGGVEKTEDTNQQVGCSFTWEILPVGKNRKLYHHREEILNKKKSGKKVKMNNLGSLWSSVCDWESDELLRNLKIRIIKK